MQTTLSKLVFSFEHPKRVALSSKYPFLAPLILNYRCAINNIKTVFNPRIGHKKELAFYSSVAARHQSLLRRRLGDSNPKLQDQKIINLRQAVKKLNGIVIQPGKIFSLWKILGKPTIQKGYVNGMLLSNGKVSEGIGGGLCQLSNFLFWIFLHAPIKIIERYHHSMDVFPDNSRTLPFGSGATIMYNLVDLKIKNISDTPLQIKIWLTDKHIKGQILSKDRIAEKFSIAEKNHFFIKKGDKYYRYNEIYRTKKINGKPIAVEKIATNFAPVLYKVTDRYLKKNKFKVIILK